LVLFDTPLPRYGWHIPSAILITPFIDDVLDVHSRRASCASLCGSLGEATLVIEAATSSSSIAIASAALDGGKEVFVHTVGLARARESGGSRLLAEMGAPLVSSYEELACHLGWDGPPVV
jgi:DNA processing protein